MLPLVITIHTSSQNCSSSSLWCHSLPFHTWQPKVKSFSDINGTQYQWQAGSSSKSQYQILIFTTRYLHGITEILSCHYTHLAVQLSSRD